MISTMRHAIVDSWIGRVLAIAVFASFVGWGIGDVAIFMSSETDVAARVGQHRIPERELALFLRSELPAISQKMGLQDPSQMPPMLRQQVAYQILQRLVSRVDILEQARSSGVLVPDEALRDEIFAIPYFHNAKGEFDRQAFDQQISAQGLTERQVLDMIRDDLAARAVLQPIARSGYVSETTVKQLAIYGGTKKDVDIVTVPYSLQLAIGKPDNESLMRFYRNHTWEFMIPEYRQAHVAILSPKTVEPTIKLSDEQFKNFYEGQDSHFHQPQTRDIEMVVLPSQDDAKKLAYNWKSGASWSDVKQNAKGAAVAMSRIRPSAIPSQDLRSLVFNARANDIVGPKKTDLGWAVFRVTSIVAPKNVSLEEAKPEILQQYRDASVASIVIEKQRAFQDAVVGGGMKAAAQVPGVYLASINVDSMGKSPDGKNITLPVDDVLKQNVISHIFQTKSDDSPSVEEAANSTLYAVFLDSVTPARLAPFDQVKGQVTHALIEQQQRHIADQKATDIYRHFPKNGQSTDAGAYTVAHKAFSPSKMNPDIPDVLNGFIAHARPGDVTMMQNGDAYVVGKVTGITLPNFDEITKLSQKIRGDLQQQAGNDLVVMNLQLLAKRFNPHINEGAIQRSLSVAGFGDTAQ